MFKDSSRKSESRSDADNEGLAEHLSQKLGVSNKLPLYAVGYSGIPRSTIDRHLTTALEKGDIPIKLFMHLIKNEPLWRNYKEKKLKRTEGDRA